MDDLISRQAAIDALDVLCQEHRYKIPGKLETYSQYNEAWQDALDRAEGAIGNLPSAQQWIPCSERLPEKPGQYYVSGGDKVWICEFLIIPNFIGGWCNDVANPVVQAWMPIPEPYKEHDDD